MFSVIKEYVKRYGIELNWMFSGTKIQGLKKIESLRANVVNPDEPLFPSKLEQFYSLINFNDGDLFELHLKILAALEASKLNSLYLTSKRDPTLVYDSDQNKANVQYDPETNSISIPVSLLQPPVHELRTSPVEFAAISTLISFEFTRALIGHVKRLKEAPICNENHYESNTTIASKLQDGESQEPQDEWLAYIFGLRSSFNAYTDIRFFSCVENYSEEQVFFLSFANMWCSNTSPNSVNNLLPGRSVVLGTLSKMNEFAEAWSCPKGSKMNP
ncbi:endothelin-converting enzyme homolog [Cloeon dipterum]|uniref:endothelin-converting enzyme homolog n=1 Tax=Cloeon dipterum TaxID=197152 RepID=UPI00321F80A8